MENKISKILKLLAIITWVLGAITSLIMLFTSFVLFLSNVITFALLGFGFIAFAEIIDLLQDNKESNKRIEYLLSKSCSSDNEYVFVQGKYSAGRNIPFGHYKLTGVGEISVNGKPVSAFDVISGIEVTLQNGDRFTVEEICSLKKIKNEND